MAIISKTYGKILAALLSLLGFSAVLVSCTKYGVPCTEIKPQITGSVVSEKDETPIQGIRVVLKGYDYGYDTAYTAKDGSFFLQHPNTICQYETNNFCVELQDVDDETNGLFEDMEIPIAAKNEQNLGAIKMTPKE